MVVFSRWLWWISATRLLLADYGWHLHRITPLQPHAGQRSTIRNLSQVLLNEPWAQVNVELYQG